MLSRVLFIVLIGCTAVFASQIERKTEAYNKVIKSSEQDLQKVMETILAKVKIGEAIRELLGILFNLIQQEFVSEEAKNDIQNLKLALTTFFQQVEEQIKDEALKNAFKELKKLLDKAFNQQQSEKKRLAFVEGEDVHKLTENEYEHISNGLQELFKQILEAMLKHLGENLSDEEKKELKEALQGIKQTIDS